MSEPTASTAAGSASWAGTVPVPTLGQVVARAVPAAAVLVIVMPGLLWWLSATSTVLGPWWFVPLLGFVVLFHVLARLLRAPRPGMSDISGQRLRSALVSASRAGAVPPDPQVRVTAGVTACQRVEAAIYAVAATVGMVAAWLLVTEPSWAWWTPVLASLAVIELVRARRCWAYLRVLRRTDRAG